MDHNFATGEAIEGYLRSQGLAEASTGGGYSGWFLERQGTFGPWQIMVTDWDSDGTRMTPGKPIGISLYAPGGAEVQSEVLPDASGLPEAIERYRDAGAQQFGLAAG